MPIRWRSRLGIGKTARPAFMIHNEKDHAKAWSFRFGQPMVTASSRGAS